MLYVAGNDAQIKKMLVEKSPVPRTFLIPIFHQFEEHVSIAGEIISRLVEMGNRCVILPLSSVTDSWATCRKSGRLGWCLNAFQPPDMQVGRILKRKYGDAVSVVPYKVFKKCSPVSEINESEKFEFLERIGSDFSDRLHKTIDHRQVRNSLIKSNFNTYRLVRAGIAEVILKEQPDYVINFNGRFTFDLAVEQSCRESEVPILHYEKGGNRRDFDFFMHGTHDRQALQLRMSSLSSLLNSDPSAFRLAESWFDQKNSHIKMRSGLESVIPNPMQVVFFSSSSDEFHLIDSETRNEYLTQEETLLAICRFAKDANMPSVIVRSHPNLLTKDPSEAVKWSTFVASIDNAIEIKPESDLDSYELVEKAGLVVTFGSTIGIEAMYLGKNTVTAGPSLYSDLVNELTPRNESELRNRLVGQFQAERNRLLLYGLFFQIRGYEGKFMKLNEHGCSLLHEKSIPRLGRIGHFLPNVFYAARTSILRYWAINKSFSN